MCSRILLCNLKFLGGAKLPIIGHKLNHRSHLGRFRLSNFTSLNNFSSEASRLIDEQAMMNKPFSEKSEKESFKSF